MKKYNGTEWVDTTLRQYKTATDTFTTLPVNVYADGNTATVGISGNTVQNGTPTPDNPIMPQGTGERTGNLFDKTNSNIGHYLKRDGSIAQNASFSITDFIPVNTRYYTLNSNVVLGGEASYCTYNANKEYINGKSYDLNTTILMDLSSNVKYLRLSYPNGDNEIMLNTGSTPLPYEPYGYKIPILSAGQTTSVYLGEVETTRKIKKFVLTGEESVTKTGITETDAYQFRSTITDYNSRTHFICSHMPVTNASNTTETHGYSGISLTLCFDKAMGFDTENKVQSYLAQQYAAGTPVTVWYVLSTPETAVVNEPLMKIGDYTDTVSGITIPTITGKDAFDVETTLKPSEASLSYTGWHDASVKEKSRNLFDEVYPNLSTTIRYKAINVGNGEFTLSSDIPDTNRTAQLFLLAGNVSSGASTANNGVYNGLPRTTTSIDGYVTIAYVHYSGHASLTDYNVMLNTGSTALPYEPYWK